MTSKKEIENPKLVMKVSLIDTFRTIKPGESVTYDCEVAGPLSSARSCVTRLNQSAGREEYRAASTDNGKTYTITRQK